MRLLLLLICLLLLLPLVANSETKENDVKDGEGETDSEDSDSGDYDADEYEDEEEETEEPPVPRNTTDRRRSSIKKGNKRRNGANSNRRMWRPIRPGFGPPRRPGRPVLLLPAPIPVPSPVYVNPSMSNAVRTGQLLHQHQMQQQQQQQLQLGLQQKLQQAQNFLANNLSLFTSPFAAASTINHQPGFTISGVKSVVQSSPSPIIPRPNKQNVISVTPMPSAIPSVSNHVSNVAAFSGHGQGVGSAGDIAAPPMAPPAPPPSSYYTSALADVIHCMRQSDKVSLTALLTAPPGYSAHPFFNGRPDIDALTSSTCRIVPTATAHSYNLEIIDFPGCGVSSQTEGDGKEWLSVSIRFPLVNGLKTPDDEVITIKCKPQDRTASANHAVDFYGNLVSPAAVSSRSSVFLGHDHDLQCDLGLFRKALGSHDFTHRVNAGSAIELGQELQLRAVVHPGDGWNYAKLSDVIIYRVPTDFDANSKVKLMEATRRNHVKTVQHGETPEATVEFAHLVLSDGCRNPSYKAIAPTHPEADRADSLAILFNFKAFMFQTMAEGEAVRITAKVTACVEQADCALTHCDEGLGTFGRRRRRASDNTTSAPHKEPSVTTGAPLSSSTVLSTTSSSPKPSPKTTSAETEADPVTYNDVKLSNTTDFDRNLTVVVLTANRNEGTDAWLERDYLLRELEKQKSCPTYLMTSVGLAIVLAAVVVIFAVYVILQRRRTIQLGRSKWVTSSDRGSLWASSESTLESIGDPMRSHHGTSSLALSNPPPYLEESKFYKQDANMAANLYSSFPGESRGTNLKKTMGMNNTTGVEYCPKPDPSPSNSSTLKRADSMLRSFQTFLAASVLHTFRQQTGCGKTHPFSEPKVESHPQPDDCHCKSSKPTNDSRCKVNNLGSSPLTFTQNSNDDEPRTLGLNTFNPVRSSPLEDNRVDPTDDDLLVSIV